MALVLNHHHIRLTFRRTVIVLHIGYRITISHQIETTASVAFAPYFVIINRIEEIYRIQSRTVGADVRWNAIDHLAAEEIDLVVSSGDVKLIGAIAKLFGRETFASTLNECVIWYAYKIVQFTYVMVKHFIFSKKSVSNNAQNLNFMTEDSE